jgi:DNA repair protein RadD
MGAGNYLRFLEDWDEVYANGVGDIDESREKARREKTKTEKEAATCPACGHVWPRGSDTCPSCGFVRARRSDVIALPGELQELTGAAGKAPIDKRARQHFYSQLCHIVNERGYSAGWAAHKYKARFGVWPRGLAVDPISPEPSLWRWLAVQQQIERKYRAREAA